MIDTLLQDLLSIVWWNKPKLFKMVEHMACRGATCSFLEPQLERKQP